LFYEIFIIFASSKWTLNNDKTKMKTSIFAMMIAAAMVVASCGQKKTEEETSAPIETIIEETPAEEEVPSEEIIEGEILEGTAEEAPAVVSEN
jgi:PBP1b-binding outer membrane lipoprotein LpoB